MKKALTGVAIFHTLCFISAVAAQFMQNGSIMATALMADIIGAVLCPIALAVAAGFIGIKNERPVLKLYPGAAATIGGVGLVRGIIFAMAGTPGGINAALVRFAGAMRYLLISFILLTVWFIIFEVTRLLMSRGTKYNKPRKKS